ncbi:putative reverse transcriptase domain-containing protein [Tanacetum coccineum]
MSLERRDHSHVSDSAVTYTSVHSEARSWSIPSEDPYEEAARQLLEQAPRSPEYVLDPMELEDHDFTPTPRPGCEVGESSAAAAARQPGPTMAHRVDHSHVDTMETRFRDIERRMMTALEMVNMRVSYQVDVHSRESFDFYTRHHDAQKDRAAVRAEIEVLRRERLAYEQESMETRQALARSEAHCRALEARVTVLETEARRHEWQLLGTLDMIVSTMQSVKFYGLLPASRRFQCRSAARDATRNGTDSHSSGTGVRGSKPVARECTYQDFMKCKPLYFKAEEWLIMDVTHDVAYSMTWVDLRKKMTDKYCPRNEMKKLEAELWNLKVIGTDVVKYNQRFQELALLCVRMFPEEEDKIESTMAERQAENKRKFENTSRSNQNQQQQQNKRQNTGRAYTAGSGDKKQYGGSRPLCSKCNYHHDGPCAPKCYKCNKYGHIARDCRGTLQKGMSKNEEQQRNRGIKLGMTGLQRRLHINFYHIQRILMPVELGSFGAIIGMDWLAKYQAFIMCAEKIVRFPWKNKTLIIHGDGSTQGKFEDKSEKKRLEDVPIVQDFPEVFPEDLSGLPPTRQVEFQIDLVPGAAPVARAPYRLLSPIEGSRRRHSEDCLQNSLWPLRISSYAVWFDKRTCRIHGPYESGLAGYYRRFIEGFSKIAKPMTKLTQKKVKFEWGDKQEAAFQLLKQKLCSAPILALPEGSEDIHRICQVRTQRPSGLLVPKPKIPNGSGTTSLLDFVNEASKTSQGYGTPIWVKVDRLTNYHASIKAAPFEALYGRKCRSPVCWTKVGEAQILGPKLIQGTTEKIIQIKQRMQAARDRQNSYADLKRYVGPFKVIERVGEVAYKLELPEELSRVHNTFHVSNLKKCHADEPLAVPLDGLNLDDKLHFVEEPVEIVGREVKRLKRSRIPLVKVRWNSKRGPEFTWEREDQFKKKYPHLFTKTTPS